MAEGKGKRRRTFPQLIKKLQFPYKLRRYETRGAPVPMIVRIMTDFGPTIPGSVRPREKSDILGEGPDC
jgi:hypothetical protein